MKHYEVWIEVEEIDEDEDSYENVGEPFSVGGLFETQEAAEDFVNEVVTTFGTSSVYVDKTSTFIIKK